MALLVKRQVLGFGSGLEFMDHGMKATTSNSELSREPAKRFSPSAPPPHMGSISLLLPHPQINLF